MSQHTAHKVRDAERAIATRLTSGLLVTGQVRQPHTGTPATIYTDGSVSRRRIAGRLGWLTGWGYIATDGRYGCGRYPQFDGKVGADPNVVTELRAIWHAVGDLLAGKPLIVYTDSTAAAATIAAWQRGDTTMPAGYTGSRSTVPTLERLRQAVAANPDRLTVHHVKGHAGDVLNEAADTLAQLGMRWARDYLHLDDVTRRADGIAEGFLADYRRRR